MLVFYVILTIVYFFFFQAEDGIRDYKVTGVQTCALPICKGLNGRPFPLFKNFFSGGLGSVRGFEQGSLGPRDSAENIALGGSKKVTLNAEFMVPFPGEIGRAHV